MNSQHSYFKLTHKYKLYLQELGNMDAPTALTQTTPLIIKKIRQNYLEEQRLLIEINRNKENQKQNRFIELQNQKINQLIYFYLQSMYNQQEAAKGTEFGGSHLSFTSDKPYTENQLLGATIFIESQLLAVYCITKVIKVVFNDQIYDVFSKIECISTAEQELLIQSSLKQQSANLEKTKA